MKFLFIIPILFLSGCMVSPEREQKHGNSFYKEGYKCYHTTVSNTGGCWQYRWKKYCHELGVDEVPQDTLILSETICDLPNW